MLLLAAGAVYLMPQYFWCRTREDLELAIELYGEAKRRAAENRLRVDSSGNDKCEIIAHLTKAWKHTFTRRSTLAGISKDAMEQKLDAFLVKLACNDMPPLNTVAAFMEALGDDWHTHVFNVHLLESEGDTPVTLPKKLIIASLKGADTQGWAWWRYPGDPKKFNKDMVWGKPHHVKTPDQGTPKRKHASSIAEADEQTPRTD